MEENVFDNEQKIKSATVQRVNGQEGGGVTQENNSGITQGHEQDTGVKTGMSGVWKREGRERQSYKIKPEVNIRTTKRRRESAPTNETQTHRPTGGRGLGRRNHDFSPVGVELRSITFLNKEETYENNNNEEEEESFIASMIH